jgi:hypothetical protein
MSKRGVAIFLKHIFSTLELEFRLRASRHGERWLLAVYATNQSIGLESQPGVCS